jgi:hypothetical protein
MPEMRNAPMPPTGRHHVSALFGTIIASLSALLPVPNVPLLAQTASPAGAPSVQQAGIRAFSFADLADLAFSAQIVSGVTVIKAERLKGELAPGLTAGNARFLVQAQIGMLLRGTGGLPGTISYIVDVPLDSKGKAPKLKKSRFLLFANRVPGRPLELRLTSPYSQLDWTQLSESILRSLLTEASAATPPPFVTGIGNAFHVPGAIPGESESQIFLTTPDNRPISLSILRRPGEQPQWSVALGEMVDDGARAPGRNTLLWYRLACFLPQRLPDNSIAALSATEGEAVRRDYEFVLAQLGPCGRTIAR